MRRCSRAQQQAVTRERLALNSARLGMTPMKSDPMSTPEAAGVLTTRGGDFALHIGQDVSIGYSDHSEATVRLYLQETFTFLLLTTEAAVALALPAKAQTT